MSDGTYPLEWISRFRKAITEHGGTNQDAHSTYAGQCCYFVDTDGQRYKVTVEPVKDSE